MAVAIVKKYFVASLVCHVFMLSWINLYFFLGIFSMNGCTLMN